MPKRIDNKKGRQSTFEEIYERHAQDAFISLNRRFQEDPSLIFTGEFVSIDREFKTEMFGKTTKYVFENEGQEYSLLSSDKALLEVSDFLERGEIYQVYLNDQKRYRIR